MDYILPQQFQEGQIWKYQKLLLSNVKEFKDEKQFVHYHFMVSNIDMLYKKSYLEVNINQSSNTIMKALKAFDKSRKQNLLSNVLPWLAKKTCEIENIQRIPRFVQKQEQSITLTKNEVLILLANMFYCTLVQQSNPNLLPQLYDLRYLLKHYQQYIVEKVICLLVYFEAVYQLKEEQLYQQKLTYTRKKYQSNIQPKNQSKLYPVELDNEKKIEEFEISSLHADFANKFIGGGCLGYGNVQEEILFFLCPELLPSILFCEFMKPKEAIIITGAQRYSNYEGYGSTFQHKSPYSCKLDFDGQQRKKIVHIAIDAYPFHKEQNKQLQYEQKLIKRELNKATIGFSGDSNLDDENGNRWPVVTGNWGCGIFRGNVQLKFILQWIACSYAERKMIYCTLNEPLLEETPKIVALLQTKNINDILQQIFEYLPNSNNLSVTIFDYFLQKQ